MQYILFTLFLILQGCSSSSESQQACFSQHCFNIEIAQTQEEVMRGLQNRTSLPNKHGMLFVFSYPAKQSFWMKDTLIPLDMIWLDNSQKIVYIAHNVPPCKEDPCPTYTPTSEALYVLEINAGLTEKLGIKVGDVARFTVPGTYNH